MCAHITLGISLCVASPLYAQQQDEKDKAKSELKRVEKELKLRQDSENLFRKSAKDSRAEVRRLKERLVRAGKSIQSIEARASDLETNIGRLRLIEEQTSQNLSTRRQEMASLLATLQRLSKRPAALTLLKPDEAINTARSANLLGGLLPKIEEKATLLKNELSALLEVKKELSRNRESLEITLAKLSRERQEMKKLQRARERSALFALQEASKEAKAASKLVQKASSLKELIARIESASIKKRAIATVKKPAISTGFGLAKGTLTMPVKGMVSEHFGKALRVGKSKGIRVKTRPEAQVIAPFDGEVVFSGPFRDYGQILIISHGDGYHSLLAGMNTAFGRVGEWILAGEPVGEMKKNIKVKRDAELYIELRYNNVAFNPIPWLEK